MDCAWKPNWNETKKHFLDWWNHEGIVISMWGAPRGESPIEAVDDPGDYPSIEAKYLDPVLRARRNHYELSRQCFPADIFPVADTHFGPGSLATFLGSQPGISERTIWYEPCIQYVREPESLPPLKFDPDNKWWKLAETTLRECRTLAGNKYAVGLPDLVENIDILASLRETQTLLIDMIERPDWVLQKVSEINHVWFDVFDRMYDIVKLEDGSSAFWAFYVWGPGKTAKVQCDCSAMFSPNMFAQFVVPALTEQCEWLDHSLYHLDGTQCVCHLDHLLAIDALDAIEWTPQAGIEGGGSPRWFDMYKRILNAGKSVQVVGVRPEEIAPLLDAIGGKGVFIMSDFSSEKEVERVLKIAEPYR